MPPNESLIADRVTVMINKELVKLIRKDMAKALIKGESISFSKALNRVVAKAYGVKLKEKISDVQE